MNFFQLECFVSAVEKGSFAEVAASMHVTQPTITYQINNLEDELGEKLFLRTKKGVEATRAGELFYQDARGILEQYRRALDRFRHASARTDTVIRLGFTRYPDNYDIFAAVHRFRAKYPDTVVDVMQDGLVSDSGENRDCFDVLLHYRYNREDFADLSFLPLGRCPFYVVVNQFSPLAESEGLTLEDLRGYRQLVVEEYKNSVFQVPSLRELRKAGIETVGCENMDQLMYAIADGVGFGIYPAKYREIKGGFRRIPLLGQEPLEYGLLFRAKHSSEVEKFVRFLARELRDMETGPQT